MVSITGIAGALLAVDGGPVFAYESPLSSAASEFSGKTVRQLYIKYCTPCLHGYSFENSGEN